MGLAIKVEDMAYEAELLRSMTLATYDAIYNGCNNYEEFDCALHAVFLMAHDHMEHMKSLSNEAYALQIQEREAQSRKEETNTYG